MPKYTSVHGNDNLIDARHHCKNGRIGNQSGIDAGLEEEMRSKQGLDTREARVRKTSC
jgi:hypothetical protein